MGRYTGPSCRQCRREGTKLFLKGTKCFTEKCPVERRPYAPGQHGQATARRRKASEFSKQLREKQKIKRIYGVSEKQFRNTFEKVSSQPGITGHNLLAALETRLDNVVYRMGFAGSRKAARQLIRHRHVEVSLAAEVQHPRPEYNPWGHRHECPPLQEGDYQGSPHGPDRSGDACHLPPALNRRRRSGLCPAPAATLRPRSMQSASWPEKTRSPQP